MIISVESLTNLPPLSMVTLLVQAVVFVAAALSRSKSPSTVPLVRLSFALVPLSKMSPVILFVASVAVAVSLIVNSLVTLKACAVPVEVIDLPLRSSFKFLLMASVEVIETSLHSLIISLSCAASIAFSSDEK